MTRQREVTAAEFDRLWAQLQERDREFEPLTFRCHLCADVRFVKGPNVTRHGTVYETAKPCSCLEWERIEKRRTKIAAGMPPGDEDEGDPETKRPRNYRQTRTIPTMPDDPPF